MVQRELGRLYLRFSAKPDLEGQRRYLRGIYSADAVL
jgi:hypothetical protein